VPKLTPRFTFARRNMEEENELISLRHKKLDALRARGSEPFGANFDPSGSIAEVRGKFKEGETLHVAGRITAHRDMGKSHFLDLRDATGRLQIYIHAKEVGAEAMDLFRLLDLGDLIGAEGTCFVTKTAEPTLKVHNFVLLAKALRPLPEKWHGLQDIEARYRQRYLDLITNERSRSIFQKRIAIVSETRRFFEQRGFLEVETPILQTIAGGAAAEPFTAHHKALGLDLYLRIALELYLKRCIVGGIKRVYEIGRNFRNEGVSFKHSPEFTMLELYQAYADYFDMMDVTEALARTAAEAVTGSSTVTYRGRTIDLSKAWRRTTVLASVSEAVGTDVALDRPDLADLARSHGVHVDPAWGPGKIVLETYEKLVQPELFEPTFVMDFPREVSPLARPHRDDPALTEHVDPVIGGMELGTA